MKREGKVGWEIGGFRDLVIWRLRVCFAKEDFHSLEIIWLLIIGFVICRVRLEHRFKYKKAFDLGFKEVGGVHLQLISVSPSHFIACCLSLIFHLYAVF